MDALFRKSLIVIWTVLGIASGHGLAAGGALLSQYANGVLRVPVAVVTTLVARIDVPVVVTGGVAANNELRETFDREAALQGLPVYFPSRPLSTDNAAMIAAAAYPKFLVRQFAPMDFSAEASLALR